MKSLVVRLLCAGMLVFAVSGCQKHHAAKPATTAKSAAKTAPKTKPVQVKPAVAKKAAKPAGQWVRSKLYGVKFRVPTDWKVVQDKEGVSATSPDQTTTVLLVGSKSENMIQSAINDLKSKIKLKDVKFEKSGLTTINGLAGTTATGSAVLAKKGGDQGIQFLAYALKVNRKTVTMMIFSQAEMYEAKRDMIKGIAQTITKNLD